MIFQLARDWNSLEVHCVTFLSVHSNLRKQNVIMATANVKDGSYLSTLRVAFELVHGSSRSKEREVFHMIALKKGSTMVSNNPHNLIAACGTSFFGRVILTMRLCRFIVQVDSVYMRSKNGSKILYSKTKFIDLFRKEVAKSNPPQNHSIWHSPCLQRLGV